MNGVKDSYSVLSVLWIYGGCLVNVVNAVVKQGILHNMYIHVIELCDYLI